jgi:hypothetical protein
MKAILDLFTVNKLAGFLMIALLGSLAVTGALYYHNAVLKADLATQDAKVLALTNANDQFKDIVVRQGLAMTAVRKAQDEANQKAAAAMAVASLNAKEHKTAAAAVLAQPVKKQDDCLDAAQILNTYMAKGSK